MRKPNTNAPSGYREFLVSRGSLMAWLLFLKQHNRFYSFVDLELARERCTSIPEDGSIVDSFSVLLDGAWVISFLFSPLKLNL